jgi:hypothetical protein
MAKKWNVTFKNREEMEGHSSDGSLEESLWEWELGNATFERLT